VPVLLREAVGWLSVVVSLGGLAVSALHLGRVRWAGVLTTGFALQALVSCFYRLFTLVALRPAGLGAALALVSLVGVAGNVAIVAGVAGILFEARRPGAAPPSAP